MAIGDNGNVITLFETQGSDATSSDYVLTESQRGHYIIAQGTFGGGTVTIEMQIGGVWAPLDGGSFTEDGIKFMEGAGRSKRIRAVLAGATTPSVTVAVTK